MEGSCALYSKLANVIELHPNHELKAYSTVSNDQFSTYEGRICVPIKTELSNYQTKYSNLLDELASEKKSYESEI